jgi:protein involved in polysaccharide export with SLBB domain
MRLLRRDIYRGLFAVLPLALAVALSACAGAPPADPQVKKPSPEEAEKVARTYPLRVGDKIKVELGGIPDKIDPMERDIKEDGNITLAYIGDIKAAGRSPSELEKDIKDAYVPKWFNNVNVSVTPLARYFYVMGMVNGSAGSGRIFYTPGITVLGAISSAGDFTPFANKHHVQITRHDGKIEYVDCIKALKHPELDVLIYPGDRINVPRRVL